MFNKKSILIALTLVATITLLGLGFKSSYSLQHNSPEEQYKQYVLTFIDEFQSIEDKDPIILSFEPKTPEITRKPIQLRIDKLNAFNYTNEVPAKYTDINTKLIETINLYKQNYESLYEGIISRNGQLVGSSVGNLYGYDIIFQEIENLLKEEI